MSLPRGIRQWPGQDQLIALNQRAVVEIDTRSPGNLDYQEPKNLGFGQAVGPFLRGDWEDFDRFFALDGLENVNAVYSRAEHIPSKKKERKPNITVVSNLVATETRGLTTSGLHVLGCSMGESLEPALVGFRVDRVVEFLSFGALVLDFGNGRVELWAAQPGDKVAVPAGCQKFLYNLGDEGNPLITLDLVREEFGDQGEAQSPHPSRPDPVVPPGTEAASRSPSPPYESCGPILLVHYDDAEAVFTLNRLWVNSEAHTAGVRLQTHPDAVARQIRIARGARLGLGRFLYEQLTHEPEVSGRFAKLGITVRQALPEVALGPLAPTSGQALHVSMPLAEVAASGSEACRYFFPNADPPENSGGSERGPAGSARPAETLNRRLVLVVEGAGDWVTEGYRTHFKRIMERAKNPREGLSIVYTDDTRWRPRPSWTEDDELDSWEIYLDKSKPEDRIRYRLLTPDAVFVVTPDFTHSDTAQHWLGRAPMVFVEKPFDSRIEHVTNLQSTRGQLPPPNTRVRGLDHYQFYALPVAERRREILRYLEDLKEVRFFLAETGPIKPERVRSLQHGLTLDLLPHLVALLTYFGSVASIDEIAVLDASSYGHEGFRNETACHLRFSFTNRLGDRRRIPCTAVVGKGFSRQIKYMELSGTNERAVRIDLCKRQADNDVARDAVLFLGDPSRDPRLHPVKDPYSGRTLYLRDSPHECPRLERGRYERLLEDLMHGEADAAGSTLSLTQAWDIVHALDRIWWAVQRTRPWGSYPLGDLDPLDYSERATPIPPPIPRPDAEERVIPIRHPIHLPRRRLEPGETPDLQVETRGPFDSVAATPPPPITVHSFLQRLRQKIGGYPLTLLLHGWGTPRTDEFLRILFDLSALPASSSVWLVPEVEPTRAESRNRHETCLDLDLANPTDCRLHENLVADVLFLPADSSEDIDTLRSFEGRVRALVLDSRGSGREDLHALASSLGIPTHSWFGDLLLDEGDGTASSQVEQPLSKETRKEIGRKLADQAASLENNFYQRYYFQHSLREETFEEYPDHPTWTEDLMRLADECHWPEWTHLCLPKLFVRTSPYDNDTQKALIWKWICDCIPGDRPFEVLKKLCRDEIFEVQLEPRARDFAAGISRLLEERLRPKALWGRGRFENEILMLLEDLEQRLALGEAVDGVESKEAREAARKRIRTVREQLFQTYKISGVPSPSQPDG